MKMNHLMLLGLALVLCPSLAARDLRLVSPLPMDNGVSEAYSPVSGGHAAEPVTASDASGVALYRFDEASAGMIASQKGGDLNVGDPLAPPEGVTVDWVALSTNLYAQSAFASNYVFYTGSTNANERIVVARFGTFSIDWPLVSDGPTLFKRISYEAGVPQTVVPHRLFWTSAPFNGPGVSMSGNYGMKLFGDPALFMDESNTNEFGVLNLTYGVYYEKEQNLCLAYAEQLPDGTWHGPKGEFVVAYYDSGACEHYLGCTVVEVTGPDATYLTAHVGDELRPQNENYDPASSQYTPLIQSVQNDTDDGRAPYVYLQDRISGQYHKKENRVYAIAETFPGETGAKKAEVFWEAADDFDVFWPFEQTCYHITWPDCPAIVLGSGEDKGPGITIPSCYNVSLLDWREPSDVAAVSGADVVLNRPGHFTLKLTNQDQDDFWLVPLTVAYSDDDSVFPTAAPVNWSIGAEIRPQVILASSDPVGAKIVQSVDRDLPGYLHEPRSTGRNWNPELYHPDGVAATGDFADLVSTLYFVNTADGTSYDAEVWWRTSYATGDMPEKLVFPVLPQRYKAAWPQDDNALEIVYSSGAGSGAGGRVGSGTAVYLPDDDARATLSYTLGNYVTEGAALLVWVNPMPEAAWPYQTVAKTGDVIRVSLGTRTFAVNVVEPSREGGAATCRLAFGDDCLFDCRLPANRWTALLALVATNEISILANGRLLGSRAVTEWRPGTACDCEIVIGSREAVAAGADGTAAAGFAVDGLRLWDFAPSLGELAAYATNGNAAVESRAVVRVDFAQAFTGTDGSLYAQDAESLKFLRGANLALVAPGRPTWDDGLLQAADGIAPRVYCQNDPEGTGYNPNEEHALALAEKDAFSVYALRTDMNDDDHPPYVLAAYNDNGRGAMRLYRVSATNEWYAWPHLSSVAGGPISVFHPFDALPKGQSAASEVAVDDAAYDRTPTYRDRNGSFWARRDGDFRHCIRYIGEPGFVCTAGRPDERGLEDKVLPAMCVANAYVWPVREEAQAVRSDAGPVLRQTASAATPTAQGVKIVRAEADLETLADQRPGEIPQTSVWPDPSSFAQMSVAQVLTKDESGLPDVYDMKTCAIAYPYFGHLEDGKTEKTGDSLYLATNRIVKLIDPTVRKSAKVPVTSSFPDEYGFTLGSEGNLVNRKGYYYFDGLPPIVSDRLFVDINSAGAGYADLVLVGDYHDSDAGVSYLRVNSLSAKDRDAIKSVFAKNAEGATDAVKANVERLKAAVDAIYAMGDTQPSRQLGCSVYVETNVVNGTAVVSQYVVVSNDYTAADHYALVATGEGAGWITLVENDGPGAENLPVSLHAVYVGTNLYAGKIVALTDKNNTLSEQLSMLFTAPLGKAADGFAFDWFYGDEPSDGHVPTVPYEPSATPGSGSAGGDAAWKGTPALPQSAVGAYYVNAVENANGSSVSMKDLVNRYWTMHYRAADTNSVIGRTTGGRWSSWCQPMLAEGWVQRVLNAITPFSQRLSDLYENKAELKLSMPAQIGAPWKGDVALNNETLASVGLEQLYRTILNRAESMSIAQGAETTDDATNDAVNKQLVEVTARLADMQMTLGAEAYSDAQNPLIASTDGSEQSGAVFCFANQVPTLLDEELALLRGRTKGVAPALTDYPFYNRLMWNFTKGVTQGEVAYVNNYNISAVDGVLDAEAAAQMYPQGHGDAYGYYLSTVKGYYRLLRNPHFEWGKPAMMSMVVADHVVNMDYQEEDKFAEAAYNMAKIGAEVVSLTARKQWKNASGDIRSAYFDNTNTVLTTTSQTSQTSQTSLPQAFGYGEWGVRAGYGAFVNWAVANTLLPESEQTAVRYFTDRSIATVTRETSASLSPLASQVARIENTVNSVDSGLNPLGLSENAIPFDISPSDFQGGVNGVGAKSHYEQIRERAGTALANAKTVLDYANVFGSRLRAIENEQFDTEADAAEMEQSYDKQLIAIYGRPFSDDIGPGKTYEQGYTGPDLYHYMYMNLAEYGLDDVVSYTNAINIGVFDTAKMNELLTAVRDGESGKKREITAEEYKSLVVADADLYSLSFNVTADGLLAMPTNWVGSRACEGSIQAAYRSFLSSYVAFRNAYKNFQLKQAAASMSVNTSAMSGSVNYGLYEDLMGIYNTQKDYQYALMALNVSSALCAYFMDFASKGFQFTVTGVGNDKVVGMANSLPFATMMKSIAAGTSGATYIALSTVKCSTDISSKVLTSLNSIETINSSILNQDYTYYTRTQQALTSPLTAWQNALSAAQALQEAEADLQAAQQNFRTVLEEGSRLLEERALARTRLVNQATMRRYQDMYARVARNNALSKFSTAFDVAQRYVFELAKVYDYETGLDVSDSASGKAFVNATVATRALGTEKIVADNSVTDGGLWDLVNRMDANFAQLKGRLGINNPDISTKWFSLRYSLYRIDPGERGDAAWRQELEKHWVDDILADKRFARYCEPPQRAVKAAREPGFVFTFSTSINLAENLFGRPVIGGETAYSSSDYAVKVFSTGLDFTGYDSIVAAGALVDQPNVYLVPIGRDYMRAPLTASRKTISFSVVDQVLPLPYDVGEEDVETADWVATFNGLDGTADSAAKIRRHSTLRVDGTANSKRLVSRSVWNDEWLLVIPAAELHNNVDLAKKNFLGSADAHNGVKDIRIGIQAYSRSGN